MHIRVRSYTVYVHTYTHIIVYKCKKAMKTAFSSYVVYIIESVYLFCEVNSLQ